MPNFSSCISVLLLLKVSTQYKYQRWSRGHKAQGQTRRHGGAFRGCAPPNDCLCPPQTKIVTPQARTVPEEINRLGATGVQIEVQIGVCQRYFCNFCRLTPDFMTYLKWRPFFLNITCYRPEKTFKFLISADWDKFLVHLCPSRIYINNLLVPPKIYFCPPPPVTLS